MRQPEGLPLAELYVFAEPPHRLAIADGLELAMPIYFFDIVAIDHQGHEFVDPEHAHKEAVRTIAAIAAEEIPKDGTLSLTVSVADASHHVLFKKPCSIRTRDTKGSLVQHPLRTEQASCPAAASP